MKAKVGGNNYLEEAAQSFIDNHLDSLKLLRKHICGDESKNSHMRRI